MLNMKKYIGLVLIGLMISGNACAYTTCVAVGGTEISTTNRSADAQAVCNQYPERCNNKTFCLSKEKMNWWTAQTWCKSIGGSLASAESVCPSTDLRSVDYPSINACPNMVYVAKFYGVGDAWTNAVSGSQQAFTVATNSSINSRLYAFNRSARYFALCE